MARLSNNKRRNFKWGLLFILPGLISYALFSLYPLLSSFVQSFNYIRGAGSPWRFVGLENYKEIFTNKGFWNSMWVTFLYVLMTVPFGLIISFIVAVGLASVKKFRGLFRSLYFLPSVAGVVVIGIIFSWMYEPYNGLLNLFFDKFGLGPFKWLRGQSSALASIAVMTIWRTMGYNVVILMAGILSVPKSIYEAADIDGISAFGKHLRITVPMTLPTIEFVLIYNTIQSVQVFTEVFVMTGGGPGVSTKTIGFRIYEEAFLFLKFGNAAANSIVLMLIMVAITLIQFKVLNSADKGGLE